MAAKRKQADETEVEEVIPESGNPLILTISEINQLSEKEKEAFRKAGGTSIEG